jgi:dTDP-4-dehydrorhamnose 3,5-epimerase
VRVTDVCAWNTPKVLPTGTFTHRLTPHADTRGTFTEIFRESWAVGVGPVQWNVVRSAANVLRGVHAHHAHTDYLTVLDGSAAVALHDLRADSETEGLSCWVELRGDDPMAIVIPPGVAHGFYFDAPSLHLYAVDSEWNPDDELGCHWADAGLGLTWPCVTPEVSERDAALGSLDELRGAVRVALAA